MPMGQVLIVDDCLLTRDALAKLLEHEGYSTATAANGRDAWTMLYQGLPRLIVLDLMMPQMDGLTFLKLLRRSDHWSHVPVLVLSGFADQQNLVERARALGVIDIFSKAQSGAEPLVNRIREVLGQCVSQEPESRPRNAARRGAIKPALAHA